MKKYKTEESDGKSREEFDGFHQKLLYLLFLRYTFFVSKKVFIIFSLIIAFSFVIRIYRINQPNHYYFDEVYHVVTARAYAQNNPEAYNPFAPPPEKGTAFD